MFVVQFFNRLDYENKLIYLRCHIQYLIEYTNELIAFVFMYNDEISTCQFKEIVDQLNDNTKMMMDIWFLFLEIKGN